MLDLIWSLFWEILLVYFANDVSNQNIYNVLFHF